MSWRRRTPSSRSASRRRGSSGIVSLTSKRTRRVGAAETELEGRRMTSHPRGTQPGYPSDAVTAETVYQRGDKFVRVIALFDLLYSTHQGRTTQEPADELGVDIRSVQRYVKQMEAAGLDIERDDQGRYRVGEGSRLPPR